MHLVTNEPDRLITAGEFLAKLNQRQPGIVDIPPTLITHVDMDGLAAAYVVRAFLLTIWESKGTEQDYTALKSSECFLWNYGQSTQQIEEHLDGHKGLIYMTDILLPDDFMSKYAKQIIWIDHHHTSLAHARKADWYEDLLFDASQEYADEYMDYVNTPIGAWYTKSDRLRVPNTAPKISATELVWIQLAQSIIPQDEFAIPLFVHLVGRYDVWDLYTPEIRAFNMYCRYYLLPHIYDKDPDDEVADIWKRLGALWNSDYPVNYKSSKPGFMNLFTMLRAGDVWALKSVTSRGMELIEAQQLFDEADCISKGVVCRFDYSDNADTFLYVINRGGINSEFFKGVFDKTKTFLQKQGCINFVTCNFSYSIATKTWVFGFYDLVNNGMALPTMERMIAKVIRLVDPYGVKNICISSGGHPNACGCVLTQIEGFLNILEDLHPIPLSQLV